MTWVVDGRTFAMKVKNPTYRSRSGSCYKTKSIECPACGHAVQINSAQEWPGLPTGVKFDPSDHEILEHLAAKVGIDNAKPHPLIDEFIPTLDGEDGICYTHPENFPGIKYDGSSAHFFHRPARAYTTGTRKRRKIQLEPDDGRFRGEMRWHKTGKTRLVVENGKQMGCKKIMVLYSSFQKKGKPEKANWVMHQYHLGVHEEEKEGELVVSKVFYQTQLRQSVGGNRGDSGFYKLEELEMDVEAAESLPKSGASAISSGLNYRGAPMTPQIPVPPRPQMGKQHRGQNMGLLEAISEEVERMTASLNANYLKRNWSQDQSTLATEVTSITADCRFDLEGQGAGPSLCHRVMEGNQDTRNFSDRPNKYWMGTGQPSCEVHSTLKDTSLKDCGQNFCSTVVDISLTLDNMLEAELKADPLENIVLDTPPDLLLESFLNSQDTLDWLEKRRFPCDSQRGSIADEEFDVLGYLRDSQSSA